MGEFWSRRAKTYGASCDREEKQRELVAGFVAGQSGAVLELACGNGRVLQKIRARNPALVLFGVDANARMIEEAAARVPEATFVHADVAAVEEVFPGRRFDVVYAVNSLHNLRGRPEIDRTLETMKRLVAIGGYVAFDVRNAMNPFISSAYARHRRDGLQFFPASPWRVLQLFPTTEFELIRKRPVGYDSLAEAGMTGRSILHRIVYAIYLRLTRNLLLSPYLLYILRRRCQSRSPSIRLA